jgi:hypothetical protein
LAPSLSSPHLFVKPSTFSLLLNCFSPSSLHPSVFHSLSSSFSHHSGCSAHSHSHRTQVHYPGREGGEPFPWTTGETLGFGAVSVGFRQGQVLPARAPWMWRMVCSLGGGVLG